MIVEQVRPGTVTLRRQPGEPAVKNESGLFHRLRNTLQELGEDVIKKEMGKDGHLVSDKVYYVRSRKTTSPGAYALLDDQYALRNSASEYNRNGNVTLSIWWINGPPSSGKLPFLEYPYGRGAFEGTLPT